MYFVGPSSINFINMYPDSQSIGAAPIPGANDRTTCENGCRADSTCLSYQINANPGQTYCSYQRNQGQLVPNLMAKQPSVVEYIKTSSPRPTCKYHCISIVAFVTTCVIIAFELHLTIFSNNHSRFSY